MTITRTHLKITAFAVPALVLLGACGSSVMSGDSDSADRPAAASAGSGGALPGLQPEGDGRNSLKDATQDLDAATSFTASRTSVESANAPETKTEPGTEPATPAVISKGRITLRSKDLDGTRFKLQQVLDDLGGNITNEQSTADKKGNTNRQRLELRVPSKNFDDAMTELSGLGTLVGRSRTSEDVTTQVIDNAARVRSQRLSLQRVQALLAKATTLSQVISIESQLSRRQADLESLEQQQKFLADQTSMATINVYLTVPTKPAPEKDDDDGFLSGFSAGWDKLGSSTVAILTGTGAVLPFAALLALVGFPVWATWRRRTGRAVPAEA